MHSNVRFHVHSHSLMHTVKDRVVFAPFSPCQFDFAHNVYIKPLLLPKETSKYKLYNEEKPVEEILCLHNLPLRKAL